MKRALLALVATVLLPLAPALSAQERPTVPAPRPMIRGAVHYGKWLTAAAAVGFTVLAAREHSDADRNWLELLDRCRTSNAFCQQGNDGRYLDDAAEELYQQTLYFDRRARRRIIAGQVSLLATATLFILDLRNRHGGPPNIPVHGLELMAEPEGSGARVGMRVHY